MARVDVQRNKNKQKQAGRSTRLQKQWEAYANTSVNIGLLRFTDFSPSEIQLSLPVKHNILDLSSIENASLRPFVCRACDFILVVIADTKVDYDQIRAMNFWKPSIVVAHTTRQLKGFANEVGKRLGASKVCLLANLSMVLKDFELETSSISTTRMHTIMNEFQYADNCLIGSVFVRKGIKSDVVRINGTFTGVILEAWVDGVSIPGSQLVAGLNTEELVYPYTNCVQDAEEEDVQNEDEPESEDEGEESVEMQECEEEEVVLNPACDLINKYAGYRGMRDPTRCTFSNKADEIPEFCTKLAFYKDPKRRISQIKNFKGPIADNKLVTLKIHVPNVPASVWQEGSSLVVSTHFYDEQHATLMNYDFTSTEPLPPTFVVDNGIMRFAVRPIVTRNLNCTSFKEEPGLVSGVVSFPAPLGCGYNEVALAILERDGKDEIIKLYNGRPENRIFYTCATLKGKPIKIHKRHVVVRGMFYNRDQVEYFRNIQLNIGHGNTGFIKKPLGTKGTFKAYFAQQVSYTDTITMKLYKRTYPADAC